MPFYEYICPHCGHEFEQLQKFSDEPLTHCPKCQAQGLQQKISAPAFHLKGSGWYVTDFKKDAKASSSTESNAEPQPADAKSETKATTAVKSDDNSGGTAKTDMKTEIPSKPSTDVTD